MRLFIDSSSSVRVSEPACAMRRSIVHSTRREIRVSPTHLSPPRRPLQHRRLLPLARPLERRHHQTRRRCLQSITNTMKKRCGLVRNGAGPDEVSSFLLFSLRPDSWHINTEILGFEHEPIVNEKKIPSLWSLTIIIHLLNADTLWGRRRHDHQRQTRVAVDS